MMRALVLHRDIMPALQTLTDAQIGDLTRRVMALITAGEDNPPEDPSLHFAWNVLREKVADAGMRYELQCESKSARARKARSLQIEQIRRFMPTPARACPRQHEHAHASRTEQNRTEKE